MDNSRTDTENKGCDPHPDYSTYSDAHLDQEQSIVDERIRWAQEDKDPCRATYYEQRMRLLQTERARRNGHIGARDSFPHLRENNPAESFSGLLTWEQFLSTTPATREWTVHEMIPESELGVIQGRGWRVSLRRLGYLYRVIGRKDLVRAETI